MPNVALIAIQAIRLVTEYPGEYADDADELPDERRIVVREADGDQPPDSDDAMDGDRANRVVDLQFVECDDGTDDEQAADGADRRCGERARRQVVQR